MKRCIIFLLILSLVIAITGCRREQKLEDPTPFYYCKRQITYNEKDNVFTAEQREAKDISSIDMLIEDYLKGPNDNNMVSIFPSSLEIKNLTNENGYLTIEFSPHLSRLSPSETTLACTALSLTLFDYADVLAIEFLADGVSFNGKESMTITRDVLLFSDTAPQKDPAQ